MFKVRYSILLIWVCFLPGLVSSGKAAAGDSLGIQVVNGEVFHLFRVNKGDNLTRIAKRFDTSVASIISSNQLPNAQIKIGQLLLLPSHYQAGGRDHVPDGFVEIVHRVKKGETLYALSRRYRASVADLQSWNQDLSTALSIGQEIFVRFPQATGNAVAVVAKQASQDDGRFGASGPEESNASSGKSNSAAGKSVASSGKSNSPAGKSVSSSGKSDSPAGKSVSSSGKSDSPAGKSVSSSGKSDSPAGKSVASGKSGTSDKSSSSAGKSVSSSGKSSSSGSIKPYKGMSDPVRPISGRTSTSNSGNGAKGTTNKGAANKGTVDRPGASPGAGGGKGNPSYHVVKQGESLYIIGKRYAVSVQDLRKWNKLTSSNLKPGQRLRVSPDASEVVTDTDVAATGSSLQEMLNDASGADDSNKSEIIDPELEVLSTPVGQKVPPGAVTESYTDAKSKKQYLRVKEQGRAGFIDDVSTNQQKFYAFHKYLPVGSYIRIDYPARRQSILVEVINQLPAKDKAVVRLTSKGASYLMLPEAGGDVVLRYVIPE